MVETKNAHISAHDNSSDLLTKVLYGAKRKKFVGEIVYDIYDWFVLFARSNPLHMDQTWGEILIFSGKWSNQK